GAISAEGRLQEAGRMAALEAALATLPDRQRQAGVLRHIEGLTNPEIAAVMEIGVEAVESLTARGKRALAELLSGQKAALGYEDDQDAG
ncbi:MAG: RNA polymerase subunit sigma, partial [Rhodobacterales bacterium]|nr:RNA polymerase subunit sigma [Rhodobacterales bacterium]